MRTPPQLKVSEAKEYFEGINEAMPEWFRRNVDESVNATIEDSYNVLADTPDLYVLARIPDGTILSFLTLKPI